MRLISILEGIWPHNIRLKGPYSNPVNVYFALDGVLAKPDWMEMSWRFKTDKTLKFFLASSLTNNNKKVIRAALDLISRINDETRKASGAVGGVYVAAYSMPRDTKLNMKVLQPVISQWIEENYPQIPVKNILFNKPNSLNANDILIDTNINNIRGWQDSNGTGILFDEDNPVYALRSLKAPPGPLSAKIDIEKSGMFSTEFRKEDRPLAQTGQFHIKDEERNMLRSYRINLDNIIINTESGEPRKMTVYSPFSTDNKAEQYLFSLLKKEKDVDPTNPDPEHVEYALNEFIEKAAVCLTNNFLRKIGKFDSIHIPESSSEVAYKFASILQDELNIPPDNLFVWTKNTDASSVIVNQAGVQQVAFANLVRDYKLTSAYRSKRDVKSDNERLVQAALDEGRLSQAELNGYIANIKDSWQAQAVAWVKNEKATKNLDPLLRRGNLLNLYVPPTSLDMQSLADTNVLLADDVLTYGMTLRNIAASIDKANVNNISAATIYKFL